jgi:hypothetical protein
VTNTIRLRSEYRLDNIAMSVLAGLVNYSGSDSDSDIDEVPRMPEGNPPAPNSHDTGPHRPMATLPSAADLLDNAGNANQAGIHVANIPPVKTQILRGGTKRGTPATGEALRAARRAVPDKKQKISSNGLPAAAGLLNDNKAKSQPHLLPPQLRGRSNVPTEDSSVFTARTQQSMARRRSGAVEHAKGKS